VKSKTSITAFVALLLLLFTASSSAQEADAQIPVTVNVGASVTIDPPAIGLGTGAEGTVTANTQRSFDIKLVGLGLEKSTSVSHRQQAKAGTGAWISHSRGNITLNLQSQQYQNAAISLYSVDGRRIFSSKASASSGELNISRGSIPAGVYLLSVKSANGNSFATRITHRGNNLNINVAFSGAGGQSLSKNMVVGDGYGEWTITVSATGHITQSQKFSPVAGNNPLQSFTLTPVTQTTPASFTQTVGNVSFDMVYIPSGRPFILGCEPGSVSRCPASTTPVSGVTVSPYFIGKAQVSSALWRAVMGGNGSPTGATWYEALEFACKLSQMTGRNYRMMTEAEFEYAAKNHLSSLDALNRTEEWAYNTWSETLMGGTDPVGPGSGSHNQKTRRNAQNVGDNITGRLIRSIEGVGPALRLTLSADGGLPPNYVHPCRLHAPEMNDGDFENSYRDPRWVTGSDAQWVGTGPGGMGGTNIRVWEDGTARVGSANGQWFTSNNIAFVFVPSSVSQFNSVTRYMYIYLNFSDVSFITDQGGAGRLVKEAASHLAKPPISNLMSGEELARAQANFDTFYKMVDMVNMPQPVRGQDERLLDGPNHGWLQLNRGSAHHYRKDVDRDEFRFIVSGGLLANGSWFTINNSFLRVTHPGSGNNPRPYVADYLYVITAGQFNPGRFMHNSFMGYERGDFRSFERLENSNAEITQLCSQCVGEIPKGQNVSFYANMTGGLSTFVPAPCPPGGCQ